MKSEELLLFKLLKEKKYKSEHQKWNAEQREKVGWPDESHFLLNHVSVQVHVCSLPGEHMTMCL